MINKNDLIGEWTLLKFEIKKPDKDFEPWREKPHGLLIYTATGYMSVAINGDKKNNSILFYTGTFEIINQNEITHCVKNASDPTRIGKNMIRTANITDNTLQIMGKGDFGIVMLTWKKLINNHGAI